MKTKITKKVRQELKQLLDHSGYWSDEVRIFIAQFDYISAKKLHDMSQVYEKYRYGL
jgi:hypothetical protein